MKAKNLTSRCLLPVLVTLLIFSFLSACNRGAGQLEIAGSYVNHAAGDYSVADDTLVVEQEQGDRFLIHRRTGFNLIRKGKKGKREYEREEWHAIYDQQRGVLTETRRGKILIFSPGKLVVGSRVYEKLN